MRATTLGKLVWAATLLFTLALSVAATLALSPSLARAQRTFDPQFFHPAPAQRSNPSSVYSADPLPESSFELGVLANYDAAPLVVRDAASHRLYNIIESQTTLHVLAAVGLFGFLELGGDVPVILTQQGDVIPTLPGFDVDASGAGAGLGDARLMVKAQFFTTHTTEHPGGAAMALVLEGLFPTGNDTMYQGDGWRFSPKLVLDGVSVPGHRFSFDFGYTFRRELQLANLSVGGTFDWGFAAHFESTYLHVIPEVHGSVVVGAAHLDLPETPIEAGLTLRFLPATQLQIQVGGSIGLVQGFGAPDFRIIAGMSWLQVPDADRDGDGILNAVDECPDVAEDRDHFEDANGCPDPDNDHDHILDTADQCPLRPEDVDEFEDENGCPDPDNDQDHLLDAVDHCPNEPEDVDGFDDADGCPDPDNDHDNILDGVDRCPNDAEDVDQFEDTDGCPDLDNDHDLIPDARDRCPNDPEDRNGVQDDDGCPEVDTDHDGLLDPIDHCPTEPEDLDHFEDEDGCPDPDNDHDSILDGVDHCPNEPETVNHFQDEDGCPDVGLVEVTCHAIVIHDRVYFATDRAVILSRSFDLLNQVAAVFSARPDIRRVSVEGHTDSQGRDARNLDLSNRRAASVRDYLIAQGVPAERLSAQGFGETRPVETNATSAGRAENRRVEFVITDQAGCVGP